MAQNPYTLGDLKAELRPMLFPTGEATNLVSAHDAMFVEALIDLQQWVPCLQINNTQYVPQCATLFRCGLTVFDAPGGGHARINKLYVVDRINQTTGLEDPTVPVDYCSEIDYRQVDYADLNELVSTTLAGTISESGFFNWFGVWNWGVGSSSLFGFPQIWDQWQGKYTFPPPDDSQFPGAPPLPPGFHYPQKNTDAPTGRSYYGLWALRGGLIYVAPWIQSTETIVVEWDGLKRDWTDQDLVDNDPILKQAVEEYVRATHARKYDHDYDAAGAAMGEYATLRARLIYECQQENEIRETNARGNSKARGAALVVPTFSNTAQQATAQCPTGTVGSPSTYTVPAGTIVSLVSQADADSQAASLALQLAGKQLVCAAPPVTYWNTTQSYTATCGTGVGGNVTRIVPAHTFSSLVSQADANSQALQAATADATSHLNCVWTNVQQSYTANCIFPATGTPVTITIAAGTVTSSISQSDADAQALTQATNQANAALVCTIPPNVYGNTPQTQSYSAHCSANWSDPGKNYLLFGTNYPVTYQFNPLNLQLTIIVTVPANAFTSLVDVATANQAAQNYLNSPGVRNIAAPNTLAIICQEGGGH